MADLTPWVDGWQRFSVGLMRTVSMWFYIWNICEGISAFPLDVMHYTLTKLRD